MKILKIFNFKHKRLYIILILSIGLYLYFLENPFYLPIDQLDITTTIGIDFDENSNKKFKISTSTYNFSSDVPLPSLTHNDEGSTLLEARQKNQLSSNKKLIYGTDKTIVFSEDFANHGILDVLKPYFSDPTTIDTNYLMVCKGSAKDLLTKKIPGYPNLGDFLESLIKSSYASNFLSKNYQLIDAFVRVDTEGRSLVLPYIDYDEDSKLIKIIGSALFDKDKMIGLLNIDDTKYLNLLREKSVVGLITLKESENDYVNFFATSKRKVKASKVDDNYIFDIYITLTGDIVCNNLYSGLLDESSKQELQNKLETLVKNNCNSLIQKTKSTIKTDIFEIGRYGVAITGHGKNIDWNEQVVNSTINVHVNVKIDKLGRGDF